MTTTGKLHTENKVIQLYPQNKYKYTHPIQTDGRKIPRAKPTLRGSVISKRVLMNKGRLKTAFGFAASPARLLARLFAYALNASSQIRQLSSVSAQTVRVSPFSMLWNDRLRAWSMRRVGPRWAAVAWFWRRSP